MADNVSFEVQGLPELKAKLSGLSDDTKRKSGRFALRKAANVVRDAAIEKAARLDDPETAQNIAANVVARADNRHFKRTGELKIRVGIRGGASSKQKNRANPGGDTFYWRFIEFGTRHIRAQPFMRTALSESIQAASAEFVTHYGRSIDRALKRAARRAGKSS